MSDVKDIAQVGVSALTAAQRKQFEVVHSLLLPIYRDILLLPNAAVAEIVPYTSPDTVNDAPEWFLGNLTWRERYIPFISFELASDGERGDIHKHCRIAVLNTLNGNRDLPYIALLSQGLPSLQIVRPNTIQFTDNPMKQRQSVKAHVNMNGVAAIIPDIDELETRIMANISFYQPGTS